MSKRVSYCIIFLATLAVLSGCGLRVEAPSDGPVTVAFYAGGTVSRTQVLEDGLSVNWTKGDNVALFARNSSGSWALSNQRFSLYGGTGSDMAAFSSTLRSAMPEDTYLYMVCYPEPRSVSGTVVSFTLPAAQNGSAGGGADLMVSEPSFHGALSPLSPEEDHSDLRVEMKHLIHLLRYYLPEGTDGLNGESIRRVDVQMPVPVCGTVSYDITAPESTLSLSDGITALSLELDRPIGASGPVARDYACAAVAPFSAAAGDVMKVTLYSESWIGVARDIDLCGRQFASGHATAVRLNVVDIKPYYRLKFRLDSNYIGEPVKKITLSAPSGCKFSEGGSNVFVYEPGGVIPLGAVFEFVFTDENLYRAFNGKTVQVAYDSDHVLAYQNVVPATSSGHGCTLSLVAPYLLFEDFSGVGSFSSYDAYSGGFNSGGKDGYGPFLGGWTGERIGGQEGKSVRLAARRETSVRYHSRMDSAPLARIKSPVNVMVSFDYGMGENHGGIMSSQYGMDVYVGYVTSTQKYDNGSTTGTFNYSFNINETSGSYTNMTSHADVKINNMPAGTQNRISWRAEVENHAGANNNTDWLYLDNVKVRVAQ